MIHVLIVEDEPALLRILTMSLSSLDYRVTSATTGATAIDLVDEQRPDLMMLDLGLPDIDGLDVIRLLRQHHQHLPILVLSARSSSRDIVMAFEAGANDYVTKPFEMSELIARVRAATRRASIDEPEPVISLGSVVINLAEQRITSRDDAAQVIHLTPTEWRMLETLLRHPNTIVTSSQLLIAMRGTPDHTERSYLRGYMQQLRRKLEANPDYPRHLLTEPRIGYRYQP